MNTDLIGQRFGMLTVVSEEEPVLDARGHRIRMTVEARSSPATTIS